MIGPAPQMTRLGTQGGRGSHVYQTSSVFGLDALRAIHIERTTSISKMHLCSQQADFASEDISDA